MKRTPTDIPKASKEVILEAAKLSNPAARFLVRNYYDWQEQRKRADMQTRHLGDCVESELAATLKYYADGSGLLEGQVKRQLKQFAENSPVGRWCMAQHGVGEVLAAGLIAHIDVEIADTAGSVWRFADLDPSSKWEKGKKRPYNPDLKQIRYHLGECIKRTYKSPKSYYGKFYAARKELVVARNEAGYNAERAKTFATKSQDVKAMLATGKLPASNLDQQACNYVAKLFLSHLHAVMYWDHFGKPPPKPFAISILGHAHEIMIPNTDMFPGFADAYYGGRSMKEAAE